MITNYATVNDISKGIEAISDKFSEAPIYCLGFSIGANQLLRYLAETNNNNNRIKGAVAISTPWNIKSLAAEIKKPRRMLYDYGITRNFKRNLNWNIDVYE